MFTSAVALIPGTFVELRPLDYKNPRQEYTGWLLTVAMIDLSYLTEEEQEMIMAVLKRDADLKKIEDQRVK